MAVGRASDIGSDHPEGRIDENLVVNPDVDVSNDVQIQDCHRLPLNQVL